MGINRNKEKVRDGYLKDLPEDLQSKIMGISKMIVAKINEKIDDLHYADLLDSRWAMSCIDDFKTAPNAKGEVGSVRVYQKGKLHKCMIQVTGHFRNHQYGWIEELLHEFIKDVFQEIKPEIRKKYDMLLVDEGDKGNPEEGFDIYPSPKVAQAIWDKFEGRTTKLIKESGDESQDLALIDESTELELISEGQILNNAMAALKTAGAKAKDALVELIKYIKRLKEYFKNAIIRYSRIRKAEKMQKEMDDIIHTQGYGINFDDIPGDVYKGDFFEYFTIFTEESNDVAMEVSKFALNVIKDRKFVTKVACNLVPGVGPAVMAKYVAKFMMEATPIMLDLIATTKEINMLKTKYAGKVKKITNPDGTVKMVLPAETYITVDKYKDLLNRLFKLNNGSSQYEVKINSTEDLLRIGHEVYDYCNDPDMIANTEVKRLCEECLMIAEDMDADIIRITNKDTCLSALKKYLNAGLEVVSLACKIYDKNTGEEYYIDDKPMLEILAPYVSSVAATYSGLFSVINRYEQLGELSIKAIPKIMLEVSKAMGKGVGDFVKQVYADAAKGSASALAVKAKGDQIMQPKRLQPKRQDLNTMIKDKTPIKMSDLGESGGIKYVGEQANRANTINAGPKKLPTGLNQLIRDTQEKIISEMKSSVKSDSRFSNLKKCKDDFDALIEWMSDSSNSTIGNATISKHRESDRFSGEIIITPEPRYSLTEILEVDSDSYNHAMVKTIQIEWNDLLKAVCDKLNNGFNNGDTTKKLKVVGHADQKYFILELESEYANKLVQYIKKPKANPMTEAAEQTDPGSYLNVELTESQAKQTMATLSRGIMNDIERKKGYKVSQYTANIYANIITKNLLPRWCSGYKKLTITLDSYQSFFTFEFKIPKMSPDFISRFINGREPLNAFLHRVPEIKIKMSPRIFHTMKDPNDAYNFFKAAVQYYANRVDKYSQSLMSEVMKLNHSMKHLISTTKLSGIVIYPMELLFTFDDVHMNNKKTFELSKDDINTINRFIKNIYTRYAAPEKEKTRIIEDVKQLVKELKESCDLGDNRSDITYLSEEVEKYLTGKYDKLIQEADDRWIRDQCDFNSMRNPKDPQVKLLQEKFGVKKLKKIPADLIAYITIETEAIRDANDKMMIASYCISKLEIVEWYIELLEVGSNKYVVPHSKPYLETLRTQLLACYKKIMDTKIPSNTGDRPIIDIKYPKGYEG